MDVRLDEIRLRIVATPIGNLEDASFRCVRTLREADVIACEDTRRTSLLLRHFDIPRPSVLLSYREQTEMKAAERILEYVGNGRTVAVCSDSGYPGISDPGYRLLHLAVSRGVPYEIIPGASAVPVALLLSGFPTSSYVFKGFPPRKSGPRRRFFEAEAAARHTLVVFESPFRVAACLRDAGAALGDRPAVVCHELTKRFERVERGTLSSLAASVEGRAIKGEVTLVIAGVLPDG